MQSYIRKALKAVGVLVIAIAIFFAFGIATTWWFHKKTTNFCEQITPGMPFDALRQMLHENGKDNWLAKQLPQGPENFKILIPDPGTIGEMACVIRHDGKKVISAKYE